MSMRAIAVGLAVCLLALLDGALAGCAPGSDAVKRPSGRVVVQTAAYVDDGDPKHRLDVYRPDDAERAPVFVFFHGGVWQGGDRSHYAHLGEALAARGIVAVVAGY